MQFTAVQISEVLKCHRTTNRVQCWYEWRWRWVGRVELVGHKETHTNSLVKKSIFFIYIYITAYFANPKFMLILNPAYIFSV
jgi:hypothetical protein